MAKRKKTQEVMTISQLEEKARSASEPNFGKGITVASGFDLGAKSALDTRSTVKTIAERNAHVTGNRAYEGMMVYVEEDKKTYQLIDGNWKQFGFDAEQFEAAVEDSLTSSSTTTALSANQGRVLNEKITAQGETINQINTKVTSIETTVTEIQESIEGLGTDLTEGLEALGNKVTVVEGGLTTVKGNISTIQSNISTIESNIDDVNSALEAEVLRATQAEQALSDRIDEEVGILEAADTTLNNAITAVEAKADKNTRDLAAEVVARTEADSALDAKIAANTAAINKEVTDRKAEITRVEGLITSANEGVNDEIEALRSGVKIDNYITKPAKVKILKTDKDKNISRIQITIHEGKNRQIRKMCEAIGKKVLALHRSKIGNIDVKDLKIGEWRYLTDAEISDLI